MFRNIRWRSLESVDGPTAAYFPCGEWSDADSCQSAVPACKTQNVKENLLKAVGQSSNTKDLKAKC
jgi:hypothetical protein